MPKVISRKQALAQGKKHYYTGTPCVHGHLWLRLVSTFACLGCVQGGTARYRKTNAASVTARLHYEKLREERPEYLVWMSARTRARRLKLPFDVSPEDVKAAWPTDNKCPILGIELRGKMGKAGEPGGWRFHSPSLDKIRPELGYVKGNVAIISMKANLIKQDETNPEVFRAVANWLEHVVHSTG
jgi:hypothetical protein